MVVRQDTPSAQTWAICRNQNRRRGQARYMDRPTLSKGSQDGTDVVLGLAGSMLFLQFIEDLIAKVARDGGLSVHVDDGEGVARHF